MVERTYYKNGNISSERYHKNNKLHREDDPELIRYYQNGNIYEEFEYYVKVGILNGSKKNSLL